MPALEKYGYIQVWKTIIGTGVCTIKALHGHQIGDVIIRVKNSRVQR